LNRGRRLQNCGSLTPGMEGAPLSKGNDPIGMPAYFLRLRQSRSHPFLVNQRCNEVPGHGLAVLGVPAQSSSTHTVPHCPVPLFFFA
jgi:hypothetical protein